MNSVVIERHPQGLIESVGQFLGGVVRGSFI
jgi:hypothetical protein